MKKVLKFFWKGLVPEGFNYPYTRVISNAFYGKKATLRQNALFVIGFLPVIRNFFLKPSVSERIIEDPFVLSQVQKLPKGSKVLDFGCFSSMVPLQLASIGYRVTGIDLYNYPYTHPNFIFHNQDILDNKLKSKSYDCIYAISSLEHVGRGWYEKERKNATDVAVVEQFYRLLKPGGTLLVTLPFGKLIQTPYMKVYDLNTFKFFCIVQSFLYDTKASRVDDTCNKMTIFRTVIPIIFFPVYG